MHNEDRCDNALPDYPIKSMVRQSATICDMSRAKRCIFPRCGPAEDDPALAVACFQIPPHQGEWPPRAGDTLVGPCSWKVIAQLGHGLVYAIGADPAGPIKVGAASDVLKRRDDLQVGSWQALAIFGARYCGARRSASIVESALHRRFASRRLRNGPGREWFDIAIDDFDRAAREFFNARY